MALLRADSLARVEDEEAMVVVCNFCDVAVWVLGRGAILTPRLSLRLIVHMSAGPEDLVVLADLLGTKNFGEVERNKVVGAGL